MATLVNGTRQKTGGRKKGTPNKKTAALRAKVATEGITPLEHMLKIMRDPNADPSRRDQMAKAAAPYIHPKLGAIEHSGALTFSHEDALDRLDDVDG
jgi:hypothetical protein